MNPPSRRRIPAPGTSRQNLRARPQDVRPRFRIEVGQLHAFPSWIALDERLRLTKGAHPWHLVVAIEAWSHTVLHAKVWHPADPFDAHAFLTAFIDGCALLRSPIISMDRRLDGVGPKLFGQTCAALGIELHIGALPGPLDKTGVERAFSQVGRAVLRGLL